MKLSTAITRGVESLEKSNLYVTQEPAVQRLMVHCYLSGFGDGSAFERINNAPWQNDKSRVPGSLQSEVPGG